MKRTIFGFVALSVVTLALPVFATTRGYDVQVRNYVAVAITIQITQYHAPQFSDKRPSAFTGDLKVGTRSIQVPPSGSETVHFNDAVGGYWLQWRKVEPALPAKSGVIDLLRDKRAIEIK